METRSVRRGPAEGARSSSTMEQRNFEGWEREKRIQGWNGGGCGIVERSRFTMMAASPVKANVALPSWPSDATCIPWPLPYSSRPSPNQNILNPPVHEAIRRAKIPKNSFIIHGILPTSPVCAIPIPVVDSSQSFRKSYNAHQYFALITFPAHYMRVAAHSTASLNVLSVRCYWIPWSVPEVHSNFRDVFVG